MPDQLDHDQLGLAQRHGPEARTSQRQLVADGLGRAAQPGGQLVEVQLQHVGQRVEQRRRALGRRHADVERGRDARIGRLAEGERAEAVGIGRVAQIDRLVGGGAQRVLDDMFLGAQDQAHAFVAQCVLLAERVMYRLQPAPVNTYSETGQTPPGMCTAHGCLTAPGPPRSRRSGKCPARRLSGPSGSSIHPAWRVIRHRYPLAAPCGRKTPPAAARNPCIPEPPWAPPRRHPPGGAFAQGNESFAWGAKPYSRQTDVRTFRAQETPGWDSRRTADRSPISRRMRCALPTSPTSSPRLFLPTDTRPTVACKATFPISRSTSMARTASS